MGGNDLDSRVKILLADQDLIKKLQAGELPPQDVMLLMAVADSRPPSARPFLRELHKAVMDVQYHGIIARYARAMGMSRETLRQRLGKYTEDTAEPEYVG